MGATMGGIATFHIQLVWHLIISHSILPRNVLLFQHSGPLDGQKRTQNVRHRHALRSEMGDWIALQINHSVT